VGFEEALEGIMVWHLVARRHPNIGIGTDFSLGSYPLHRPDPWGAPRYQDARGPHDDVVTTYPRSPERFAEGFSNYAEITNAIGALQKRGYTEQDIEKILGGNALRVFDRVWKRKAGVEGE
jgi:microsomal dipeptidase-like Zn-dependent dipeptidase